MSDTLLGSAKLHFWEGLPWQTVKNGFGNVVLIGTPVEKRFSKNVLYCAVERHFVSVAPTRSGKGVSLIIPNLLTYEGSVIVIDPKGENAWITAERRRRMGQKVIILDPWGEVNRRYGNKVGEKEETAHYNPLSILNFNSPDYADDLAYISDALIINQGKDPHWDDSARELVAGLISYLVETMGAGVPSLSMVRVMLSMPAEELAGIAQEAQKLGFNSVAARKLGRFKDDRGEIASIISTALTQTAFLDSRTLEENISFSDFSFNDLVDEPTTIYLVLPVDKLQTYGRWLRLLVSIGIRTIARNEKQLPFPVLFLLDEFGTIGRLSAISQAFGLMAGLQMCIWIFIQDLVQLKRDYPDEWETFLGNASAVTFFNVMDQFSAEYFSKMLGTQTIERISVRTYEERQKDPTYGGMGDQYFARSLLTPEEIRTAKTGFMLWRYQPVIFEKITYYKLPFFIKRARWNPLTPPFPVLESAEERRKKTEKRPPNVTELAIAGLKKGNVESAIWLLTKYLKCKVYRKKKIAFKKEFLIVCEKGKLHYANKREFLEYTVDAMSLTLGWQI